MQCVGALVLATGPWHGGCARSQEAGVRIECEIRADNRVFSSKMWDDVGWTFLAIGWEEGGDVVRTSSLKAGRSV